MWRDGGLYFYSHFLVREQRVWYFCTGHKGRTEVPARTQAESTVSLTLASQGKVTWIWKVNKSWEKPISLLISFFKIPWSQRRRMWAAVSTGDPGDCVWQRLRWYCQECTVVVCLKCLKRWPDLLTVAQCCNLELAVENTQGKQPDSMGLNSVPSSTDVTDCDSDTQLSQHDLTKNNEPWHLESFFKLCLWKSGKCITLIFSKK